MPWTDPTPIEPPPEIRPQTNYFQGFALAMYDNARWQVRMQQYAAGVLVAQVAVEMGALNAFTSLLVRRDGEVSDAILRELLPDVSFMEEDTRRLWTDLTGWRVTRPKDPPVWVSYHAHVEYRNRIAHGTAWGDGAGWGSVAAAGQFILRLDEHMHAVDSADTDG